jgi:hypothetical protein
MLVLVLALNECLLVGFTDTFFSILADKVESFVSHQRCGMPHTHFTQGMIPHHLMLMGVLGSDLDMRCELR